MKFMHDTARLPTDVAEALVLYLFLEFAAVYCVHMTSPRKKILSDLRNMDIFPLSSSLLTCSYDGPHDTFWRARSRIGPVVRRGLAPCYPTLAESVNQTLHKISLISLCYMLLMGPNFILI